MTSHRPATPLDVLMFRGESDPRTRSAMVGAYLLDRAPAWDDVAYHFENASRLFPGLRERLVEASSRLVDAQWVVDPDFDIAYHLRRTELPPPGSFRQVLDMVEASLMSPLDTCRPLWEATLVEGLEGGRAALVMKLSHAITDGVGGMQLQGVLFDTERDAPRRPRAPAPIPVDLTPQDLTSAAVRRLPGTAVDAIGLGIAGMVGAIRLASNPRRSLDRAGNYVSSLGRSLAGSAPPSPLLAGRSSSRRVLWTEVPLEDLRRAAKAVGATVNDAYLTALTGGLGRYHDRLGVPVAALSTAIPVSLRAEDARAGGNQWAAVSIAAPAGEPDPAVRMRLIGQALRGARDEPAVDALRSLAGVVSRLPDALVTGLLGDAAPRDIQASNVPGWPVDTYLCGALVERFIGFGPLPGAAMMVVLLSSAGVCTLGVNYDPAAVTQPEILQACLEEGIAEVVALGRPPAAATPKATARKAPAKKTAARAAAKKTPAKRAPAAGIRRNPTSAAATPPSATSTKATPRPARP